VDRSRLTLVDSSAWVELFRDTGSRTGSRLRELLASTEELATSEPVELELLVGTRHPRQVRRIRSALAACRHLPIRGGDWRDAASIYLTCRRAGTTPRNLIDCMLVAVAIRAEVPILAQDRDFERIAAHVPLQLA